MVNHCSFVCELAQSSRKRQQKSPPSCSRPGPGIQIQTQWMMHPIDHQNAESPVESE